MDHLLRRVGFNPTLKTIKRIIIARKISESDFPAIPMAAYHALNVASNDHCFLFNIYIDIALNNEFFILGHFTIS